MANAVASWRTTVAGLAVIAFGVVLFLHGTGDQVHVTAGALVVAGVGLVRAKDA